MLRVVEESPFLEQEGYCLLAAILTTTLAIANNGILTQRIQYREGLCRSLRILHS